MPTTIDELELKVQSDAASAVSGLDALASSLEKLKAATRGGSGLTAVSNQLVKINASLNGISNANSQKLFTLAQGLKALSACGNIKISSTIAPQITAIGNATRKLGSINFSPLRGLAGALAPLASLGKINLNGTINQLQRLPSVISGINASNISRFAQNLAGFTAALTPLYSVGKSNFSKIIKDLGKIPAVMAGLRAVNMTEFSSQIRQLAAAFEPLATQMDRVARGFSALPTRLQRLIQTTERLNTSNRKAAGGYANLAAKIGMAGVAVKQAAHYIASWITESNKYVENMNLFSVSMGEYADEAKRYADAVGEIMGIDPGEWARNQGVFMTLATGFGVVSDRANTMSQNLTQLGYDISSFFNISTEDAFQKLQSGISGELEPLRRLGYDLSVARLQQEALNLGITKSVNAMTQAEKAELRYYAIMTQVTTAQGDMSRTLEAPANQLRVLKAQVTQCARALGDMFIPMLNKVLPYFTAMVKVVREVATVIAKLFGYEAPEFDTGNLGVQGTDEMAENLGDAADNAKKLRNALLGIDELNIISPQEEPDTSGLGGGLGGLDFELPTYDFIGNAVAGQFTKIAEEMKEWLGLTDDIDTWSELFDTRLGSILKSVMLIGGELLAWKVAKGTIAAVAAIKELLAKPSYAIAIGVTLTVTGFALEFSGVKEAIENGLDGFNFVEILAGGLIGTGGAALLGAKLAAFIDSAFSSSALSLVITKAAINLGTKTAAGAGAALAGGIAAIIAGIPMYVTGIIDAIKNEIDLQSAALIGAGATLTGAGVGTIIGALGGSLGGPITAGIGALIGLAVGLITDFTIWLWQNFDKVEDWFNGLPDWAKPVLMVCGVFVNGIFGVITAVVTLIKKWDTIKETFSTFFKKTMPNMWNKFTDGIKNAPKTIKTAFEGISGNISAWFDKTLQPIKDFDWKAFGYEMGQKVGNAFKSVGDFFTKSVPQFFEKFGEAWSSGWNTIKNAVENFFTETLPEVWENVKASFKTFFTETLPNFFTQTIPQFWETVKTEFTTFFTETLPEKFSNIGDWFVDVGKNIIDGIWEGLQTVWTAITDFVDGFVQGFKDALGIHSPSTVFAEIGSFIIEGLMQGIDTIKDIAGKISEWAGKVVEWFSAGKNGKGIVENFKTVGGNIISGFKNKIFTAGAEVKETVTGWGKNILEWFSGTSFGGVNLQKFEEFATNVIGGFREKIGSTYTTVRTNIVTWADGVKTWFSDIASESAFAAFANNVIRGFREKIGNTYTTVKTNIVTWANSVKTWFTEIANASTFEEFASKIIDGFKRGILFGYNAVMNVMHEFGSLVKNWFTDNVSFSKFYDIAADVIEGFKNGISDLADTTMSVIRSWANKIASTAKAALGVHSPSTVFMGIGENTVQGYNLGIEKLGGTTQDVVDAWARSFTSVSPTMSFAVDTSALKYYDSNSFAKSVSANVTAQGTVTVEDYTEGMIEAFKAFFEPYLAQISEDTRRQADKPENTVVNIGNRTISDAVETQQKANGFRFVRT